MALETRPFAVGEHVSQPSPGSNQEVVLQSLPLTEAMRAREGLWIRLDTIDIGLVEIVQEFCDVPPYIYPGAKEPPNPPLYSEWKLDAPMQELEGGWNPNLLIEIAKSSEDPRLRRVVYISFTQEGQLRIGDNNVDTLVFDKEAARRSLRREFMDPKVEDVAPSYYVNPHPMRPRRFAELRDRGVSRQTES